MVVQYLLTGLAGLVLGVVAMRVWHAGASAARVEASGGGRPSSAVESDQPDCAGSQSTAGTRGLSLPRLMLIGATALVAVAVAVLALRKDDEGASSTLALSGQPAISTPGGAGLDDVDTMIGRLAQRLQKNPGDGEGFRMLGWSYVMTGHPKQAIEPYRRALSLLPGKALVHAGYAEALTGVAGGKINAEAKQEFEKAHALDPAEPRTRYFLALWKAQNGQEKQALEDWIALVNSGGADEPWQADVRREITQVSGKLGIDVSNRLKQSAAPAIAAVPVMVSIPGAESPPLDPAAMQAAGRLPSGEQQKMISGMVEGLADKLKVNPIDVDGWARLLRSRMVLGQGEQARYDLAAARKALAQDKAALTKLNAAAAEFAVPGA